MEELEAAVGQLEHVKSKQAQKIQGLQGELEQSVRNICFTWSAHGSFYIDFHLLQVERFSEKRDIAHKTVHTLTSELNSLKLALEEITKRERQVGVLSCDVTQVVALLKVPMLLAVVGLASSDGAHARS